MTNQERKEEEIAELCATHNCSEKIRKMHFELYVKRGWCPHPSEGFTKWWKPDGVNPDSGAETGGHEEAWRKCVQPETHAWKHYGIDVVAAFNIRRFREEYAQWLADGSPPRLNDYDGTAAPIGAQLSAFKKIKAIMRGSTLAKPF